MLTVPELPHNCNSWIISKDGEAVLETWSRKVVENAACAARPGVEIFTADQWLAHVNAAEYEATFSSRREFPSMEY